MKLLKIRISVEFAKGYQNIQNFRDNPLSFLINQYHKKAELIRKVLERNEI